jgi:Na+/H+ antiporter NhaD/arsenite permease-like protein
MQTTMSALHWIYLPEVLNDTQFGFCATIHYSNAIVLSLATEYMIKYLKPQGTFVYFGMVTVAGSLFFKYIVKETSGLSDKEKKQLYLP